ncbi:hypothetical protein P8452_60982 [Trifolium repens]|nr:hypothetical protein P8452_60982 [Trifolium repens]
MVGDETIGSEHPIRIKTMTTTNTKDVAGTVMKIADKRADIVRITFHGKKEVDACFEIKNSLVQKNCLTESIVETLVKMQVSSIHGFMCHKVVFLSVVGPQ